MTGSSIFASFAPAPVEVPEENHAEFLQGAPSGTVVEIDGELYKRATYGDRWIGLNDVVIEQDYGGPVATHEEWPWEKLLLFTKHPDAKLFVLRIGEL